MMSSPAAQSIGTSGDALLEARDVFVRFGAFVAIENISFLLRAGETLGLVGESGSGKSTLARALLKLIPISTGQVLWRGSNLLAYGAARLRRCRRDMQIVFQDPMASLNPRMRVGDTLAEPLKIFEPQLTAPERAARIADMLECVGLAADLGRRYPHEFSGGQCQRIGIARAMMLRPALLVCDEPVSSLDVSIQGQIVNLLADLQARFGTAMLFISHNLAVVRHLSHRVLVIYRGLIVEEAGCDALFAHPVHPYTRALWAAVPGGSTASVPPPVIAGAEDVASERPLGGCVFRGRCAFAQPVCASTVPLLQEVEPGHRVACHRWREVVYS